MAGAATAPQVRTYAHLFSGDTCEARGCRIRTRLLWPVGEGHVVRACCPAHVEAPPHGAERGLNG